MKDYKKILEGVVDIINTAEKSDIGFANICTYIGENCPELKESEDERIRKALIEMVHDTTGDELWVDYNVHKEDAIDWLEKQGEQKPAEWTMDNIEELTEFENAMMHIGGSFFGEHQGLDPNDTFVVKEQAKILLEMAPKLEWSAKDENFLNTTIAYLRDAYSKDKIDFKDTAKNCVNWLKSLRPQNTWKPSDEQMEALEHFVRSIGESGYASPYDNDTKLLYSLLFDLKKLREE